MKHWIQIGALIAALVGGYFGSPYLFGLWIRIIPPLQGGTTIHLHLYGSSRWLTVCAVGFTWWFLYRANSTGLWQWKFGRWVIIWIVGTLLVAQLLYLYSLCTDDAAWLDSGYRPFYLTDAQARFIQTYVIPLNVLISPLGFYISLPKSESVELMFDVNRSPEEYAGAWIEWGLTLLWCVAIGWLYLLLSLRIGGKLCNTTNRSGIQEKALSDFCHSVAFGWAVMLSMTTYLNVFLPGDVMDVQDLVGSLLGLLFSSAILLGISLPFTWVYYRLVALLIRSIRGFAKQV